MRVKTGLARCFMGKKLKSKEVEEEESLPIWPE